MRSDDSPTVAVGLGLPPVLRLLEPTKAERQRFAEWLARHYAELETARRAAEQLQIAYDHASVVTSADHRRDVPRVIQREIDDLLSKWRAARWAGQIERRRSE